MKLSLLVPWGKRFLFHIAHTIYVGENLEVASVGALVWLVLTRNIFQTVFVSLFHAVPRTIAP
jgi:hypothetical protein